MESRILFRIPLNEYGRYESRSRQPTVLQSQEISLENNPTDKVSKYQSLTGMILGELFSNDKEDPDEDPTFFDDIP